MMTDDRRARAVELRRAGHSRREIMRELDASDWNVRQWIADVEPVFTCQNCGDSFTRKVRQGSKPLYCHKPECRAKARWKSQTVSPGEIDARLDARERMQQVVDEEKARRDEAEALAVEDAKSANRKARSDARRLFKHATVPILSNEIIGAAHRAGDRWPQERDDLAVAIRGLAEAKGSKQTYDSLLDVAAAAMGYACRLRPGSEPYEREQMEEAA